jgi:low temperature requirement protein LtrA
MAVRAHRPRLSAALREEGRVKPLELFFDLVFVLAFTQCTALMAENPTWQGLGQGMLVLAMLWWAWVGYTWLTSVIDPEEGWVRLAFFAAMTGLLIAALCVPEAFDDRALAFAVAYGVVRIGGIALLYLAGRDDPELRHSVRIALAGSAPIAIALLIVASALDGAAQATLWVLAIAIDWGTPLFFGSSGWRLMPEHFSERHNLVIILALGESIVAIGIGAEATELGLGLYSAAALGIALAAALWWIYFDVVSLVNERRLARASPGREQNELARDSYSYLHFPMVAGIILGALGLKETIAHVSDPLSTEIAFALYGGVAIYLLAHVALRLRNAHTISWTRLPLALALLVAFPLAAEIDALAALAIVNVGVWAMIAYETIAIYDDRRWRLRHGLDVEPVPGQHLPGRASPNPGPGAAGRS